MFSALSEAERDAITVIVFIGTFFGALTVGRSQAAIDERRDQLEID